MREYYDRRAGEYDDWYPGRGLFAERDRPVWDEEVAQLVEVVAALPAARTLDLACGTGFLTRHLRGDVVALDQSESMLEEARRRAPRGTFVQGDALALPAPNESFDRVFTARFWQVYKRWFTPAGLAAELGGGETLFAGRWFVAVRAT